MHLKGPGREGMTKIPLEYIYRQAVLLWGVLWFPPQKVVSLKKGRGKKKNRKGKRGEKKTENNIWKEKEKRKSRKVTEKTANFGREETKFASCDIPIK